MNLSIIKWTPELVMEWLNIAAKVDKSLPPVKMPKVTGQKWDVLREWYELLWDDDKSDIQPKWQPTNEQITMWEEVVLRWFKLIDTNTDKKIVWMHAAGSDDALVVSELASFTNKVCKANVVKSERKRLIFKFVC